MDKFLQIQIKEIESGNIEYRYYNGSRNKCEEIAKENWKIMKLSNSDLESLIPNHAVEIF